MESLAEALISGSRILDRWREETNFVVGLIQNEFKSLDLGGSINSYFQSQFETATWWEMFHPNNSSDLYVRCISRETPGRPGESIIVYTTHLAWVQQGSPGTSSRDPYEKRLGMDCVHIPRKNLELFVHEMFVRYTTLRCRLQPLITAANQSMN